jgi:Gly-Xaa carboxypeptidase
MILLTTAVGLIIALASVKFASIPALQQILNSWNINYHNQNNICPLAPIVQSPLDGLLPPHRFTRDQSIRMRQADRLSKAVRIPTVIEESMQDPYSEEFGQFLDFHGLLRSLFPLTYVLPVQVLVAPADT